MKKFLSMALIGCAVSAQAALPKNGGYTISDVSLVSQLPWDRRVTVNFTVTPPAGVPADGILRLELVASNGVDAVYVSDASVYGGNYCGASGRQTIVWDPTVDHKGVLFSDLTFHLAVAETNVVAPYLSVRLADGHIAYHGMAITNKITSERFLNDYMVFRRISATTSDEWKALSGGKETFTFGAVSNDCAVLYKNASDFIKEQTREVKLTHDFYMAVYPVTWGQYERLGFTRPVWANNKDSDYFAVAMGLSYNFLRGADTTTQYNFPATTDVASDSLVGKMRARTGLNFDLPTEAQWEFHERLLVHGDGHDADGRIIDEPCGVGECDGTSSECLGALRDGRLLPPVDDDSGSHDGQRQPERLEQPQLRDLRERRGGSARSRFVLQHALSRRAWFALCHGRHSGDVGRRAARCPVPRLPRRLPLSAEDGWFVVRRRLQSLRRPPLPHLAVTASRE